MVKDYENNTQQDNQSYQDEKKELLIELITLLKNIK